MGLISKIKNVLFEEEEVEIPIFKKEEQKTEDIKPIRKITETISKSKQTSKVEEKIQDIDLEDNERETFKIEPTFQFPVFDEKEFEKPKKTIEEKELMTKEKKNSKKSDFKKYTDKPKEEKKKFTPSPIISPVYGIRDKNYNIQDFVAQKESPKKVIDVDSVRKKAFGSLEDEIEKTLSKPIDDFYEEKPTKSINELLIDSVDEEIPVDIELDNNSDSINDDNQDTLNVLDEVRKTKEDNLDDTLENDLFNLIDSMYTDREDEN